MVSRSANMSEMRPVQNWSKGGNSGWQQSWSEHVSEPPSSGRASKWWEECTPQRQWSDQCGYVCLKGDSGKREREPTWSLDLSNQEGIEA